MPLADDDFVCRVMCVSCVVHIVRVHTVPPQKGPFSVLAVPGDRRAVELGQPAVPALQRAPDQHAGRPHRLLRSALALRPKHAGMLAGVNGMQLFFEIISGEAPPPFLESPNE